MRILLLLLFPLISMAQDLNFGAKAGYMITSAFDDSEKYINSIDGKNSFCIGALAEYRLKTIAFQAELLYYNHRFDIEPYNYGYNVNYYLGYQLWYPKYEKSISLHTISLPLIGKYYASEQSAIYVGSNFDFTLYAKSRSSINSAIFEYSDDFGSINGTKNITSLLNKFDFGILFGIEHHFTKHLSADARLGFSTIPFLKGKKQTDYFKNTFSLNVNYRFDIKKQQKNEVLMN